MKKFKVFKKKIIFNKRFLIAFGLIALFFVVIFVSSRIKEPVSFKSSALNQDSAVLEIYPSHKVLKTGENSFFNVFLRSKVSGVKSGGVQLVINYDPKLVEILDMDEFKEGIQIENQRLYGLEITNTVNPVEGKIYYMAGSLTSVGNEIRPVESGLIATVHYRTRENAGKGNFEIVFRDAESTPCDAYRCVSDCLKCDSDVFLYRSENDDILAEVINSDLVITAGGTMPTAPTPASTLTLKPTITPVPSLTPQPKVPQNAPKFCFNCYVNLLRGEKKWYCFLCDFLTKIPYFNK